MVRIICLLIGYAFGLFQTSYIYGRTKGIDIREHGSGNAGTTNALRTLGKKAGAITLAGDCIKCILAVLTVRAALFFLNLAVTHYVSLGSMMVYVVFFAMAVIMGQAGCFALEPPYLYEMYVVIALLAVLAFWEHRANIKRLIAGTERKTYLSKKSEK